MQSPYPVTAILGTLMFLLRNEPGAGVDHAALLDAFRAFRAGEDIELRVVLDGLQVNQRPAALDAPGVGFLSEQMLLHGIQEVSLPADLPDAALLRLLGVLGAFPGTYPGFKEFLHALGPVGRQVGLVRVESEFEVYRAMAKRPSPELSLDPGNSSHAAPLDIRRDVADTFARSQEISLNPRTPDRDMAMHLSGGTEPAERAGIEHIVSQGRIAAEAGDWNGLLDACLELVEGESEAQSDILASSYRIELRRLLPVQHLRMLARLAHGDRRQEAVTILKRFGPEATDLLMDLLVEAPGIGERRSYYSAIAQLNQGKEFVIQRLAHPEWFVVRNAANLCGELELAEAVPELVRQSEHPDERVRKAVAVALGRIASPAALDTVRKMLLDLVPGVRGQALQHLGGRRARGVVRNVVELLRKEEDEDVRQEGLLALGRIGTPEALTVLAEWAAPGGRLLARKQLNVRLQAVRGLAVAGPAATDALAALQRDEAPEIRSAASAALEALRP